MPEIYSNRELEHYFTDIKSDLTEIKEQTQKTNGRVSKLEDWSAFMRGGLAILAIIVVPILIYVITNLK